MSFSNRILSILLLAAPCLHGESSLVVTQAMLPDRIHSQNPDLAAARLRIREALARVRGAGRLSNPEVQMSAEQNRDFTEGRLELGFSQRFPVTDRLRREKEISMAQVSMAEAEVREVERTLIARARVSLIEVLALRERRALLEAQAKVTAELAESVRQAAAKGEGSPLDAGQARIEAARVSAEARQLDAREAGVVGSLKPVLGMSPNQQLVVSGKLAPPAAALPGNVAARPDLEAAKLGVEIAAQEVGLEEARRYEDLEAGVIAAAERTEDVPVGRRDDTLIGLQLKFPLPFWNRNEGGIEEAKARHQRKQLEHRALTRGILLEVESARTEMAEWAALAQDVTARLLPLADAQVSLAETAWRNGQAELQAVLRAREQRLQLAATRVEALREYHLAAARHQAALGQP